MNESCLRPISPVLICCAICVLLAAAPGCEESAPPRFHANMVQMENPDNNVSPKHQQQIADILLAMYGTPDDPYVLPETGLDLQKLKVAAGPVKGYTQGLFRLHCVHCHGISGDGMGPTALFLKPYPRDYRQGWFKFKSTPSKTPPTHEDLVRTLEEGISGTAMPSFKLLSHSEIESLVEYVEYLSMRGQTELELINQYKLADAFDPDKEDFPQTREFLVDTVLNVPNGPVTLWKNAVSQVTAVPKPPADFGTEASVELGRKVYYDKGGCVKCHGPTALGDGQLVWDMWNESIHKLDQKVSESSDRSKLAGLTYALRTDSLPPRESEPRNLRQGIYRGGRQPYELFFRLYNGVFPRRCQASAAHRG